MIPNFRNIRAKDFRSESKGLRWNFYPVKYLRALSSNVPQFPQGWAKEFHQTVFLDRPIVKIGISILHQFNGTRVTGIQFVFGDNRRNETLGFRIPTKETFIDIPSNQHLQGFQMSHEEFPYHIMAIRVCTASPSDDSCFRSQWVGTPRAVGAVATTLVSNKKIVAIRGKLQVIFFSFL